MIASDAHATSVALMKFLSQVARRHGVAEHVYVVGGAVRNFLINQPIKDIDVVIDSIALGRDSEWFAKQVAREIPVRTEIVTDRYGVAKVYIKGPWVYEGRDLNEQVIEIVNARKETYGAPAGKGKGYKPDEVSPATIEEDVMRREFTFNTLLWRLLDLADGPDKAEIIDITGLGRQHLQERLMYTPLNPDRTFTDDPTRMMRAIKFFVKYNLNLSAEVADAIRRNARKLMDLPHERVADVLLHDIIPYPKAREALGLMKDLGLIDIIAQMVKTNKAFRSTLSGALGMDSDVQLLLDLVGLGIDMPTPISFLNADQHARLREVTMSMTRAEATAFLAVLKTPPIDNVALIEKYKIQPRDRGVLAATARTILLANPELSTRPDDLHAAVDRALGDRFMTTSSEIRNIASEFTDVVATEEVVAADEKVAGILDRVRAWRMDWLWGYDLPNDRMFVKKKALYAIEHIFYDYMEKMGWPAPAKDWVLTMAIVGGAASLQWKPGSDVDISIVVDWLKLFDMMKGWTLAQWRAVFLEEQYYRVQRGERIQGRVVAKQMVNCLWGFGPFKGKGIIDRTDIDATTMGHPVNYRFVRSLGKNDTRFDAQPPIVENASISAYVAELPTERRRQEDPNLHRQEVNWIHRVKDLPRGFELKRDAPHVYDEALGLLRYTTMPFDYLSNPKTPKDVTKAIDVLYRRYHNLKHDLRTEGYKAYEADPNAHAFTYNGETYALPDAFPANIAVKLVERSGAEAAIKKLVFEMRTLKDERYVGSNFAAVKAEIKDIIGEPYENVKRMLTEYSKPITYHT
jgi:tRNA nucleotidyltransferase/poly(A) polymerase